jgi:2-phospho-L-lactate guanylyltransferase
VTAAAHEAGAHGWAVVIPVKAATRGKSRLAVPGTDRVSLARAIALDTIAAARACAAVERVVVVTDDPALPVHAFDIPDLRFVDEADAGGLNEAIALAMKRVDERMPRAALLADVPALRPDDLAAALALAASLERGVVGDADGSGSTLVTAAASVPWASSFGDGSLTRHLDDGCVALTVPDDSTLRRDVDTAAHLAAAEKLGLGPRTSRVLAAARSAQENSR